MCAHSRFSSLLRQNVSYEQLEWFSFPSDSMVQVFCNCLRCSSIILIYLLTARGYYVAGEFVGVQIQRIVYLVQVDVVISGWIRQCPQQTRRAERSAEYRGQDRSSQAEGLWCWSPTLCASVWELERPDDLREYINIDVEELRRRNATDWLTVLTADCGDKRSLKYNWVRSGFSTAN